MKLTIFNPNNRIQRGGALWVFFFFTCIGALFAQLPATLPPTDSLAEEEVKSLCKRLNHEVNLLLVATSDKHAAIVQQRQTQESTAEQMQQDTSAEAALQIKSLSKSLKALRKEEKQYAKMKDAAVALYEEASVLDRAEPELQRRGLPAVWKKYRQLAQSFQKATTMDLSPEKKLSEEKEITKEEKPEKVRKKPGFKIKSKKEEKAETTDAAEPATAPPTDTTVQKTPKSAKLFRKMRKNADDTPASAPQSEPVRPESQDETAGSGPDTTDTSSGKKLKNPFKRTRDADKPSATAHHAPPTKKFRSYNFSEDVLYFPIAPPCRLTLDTRDEFSGDIRRATDRAELFRHTNPLLKAYLQGKTQVICESSLQRTGSQMVLHLHLQMNDPNAKKAQGHLPRNAQAILKFIDGSTQSVYNMQTDEGKSDAEGQAFAFEGQFLLDREVQRKMRSMELDKIRLYWANGYEDYEVHDLRLLMRQMKCVE